jgi:hypothetical protein
MKPNGLFRGFRDGDTGELVCNRCRDIHYRKKQKALNLANGEMLYSEFPVMALAPQLRLAL